MNRRIFAALLALALAILAIAAGSAEGGWTVGDVRYAFEHSMLPRYYYAGPENMLSFLADSDMYTLWASVSTENGVDVTYNREDFVAHTYTYGDATLVQVEMPEPQVQPQCYRIYFLYNPVAGEAGYYTIERDDLFPDTCCVCMWKQSGEHVNFGAIGVTDRNDAGYADALKAEADAIIDLKAAEPVGMTAPGGGAPETAGEAASKGPQPMGALDYTDDILPDGSPIYYFQELSLTLPASWQGKVIAMPDGNGVSFYQRASYEKYQQEGIDGGGFLFQLGASVNSSFSELPSFEYLGFSEESCMNYYLVLPTDYPAYMQDDIRAEYDEMSGQIDYVVRHVSFYAAGDVSEGGTGGDMVPTDAADDMAVIACPELGFTTVADPGYSWDYQEGTGISIYTQSEGNIPYVIVFKNEDLLAEPLEFIKEQFTPHVQKQYGDRLMGYVEYEVYEIGGKQLPAGLYTYKVGDYVVDMLRLFDSTGSQTISYTAKYIQGQGDETLAALDAAIRGYKDM